MTVSRQRRPFLETTKVGRLNEIRPSSIQSTIGCRLHFAPLGVALHSVWIIPFLAFAISLLSFLVSYCIAVYNKHVNAFWPYISDSGSISPESCVFGQLLNIAAIFLAMTVYLRHRQIIEYYWHHLGKRGSWRIFSNIALWIGFAASLGCSIVANFQQINVIIVHYIGAFLAFTCGLLYIWIQTVFSYKMVPGLTSHWLCHFRLFLGVISTAGYVNTIIFATLAKQGKPKKEFNPHCQGTLYHWQPSDPKYMEHTIATVSEWVLAACFQLYILSFVVELRNACCYAPKLKLNRGDISRDEPTEPISPSSSEED